LDSVSVSRGTFQPHLFSRQSSQDDATQEDAVHHGARQHDLPHRGLHASPAVAPAAFL